MVETITCSARYRNGVIEPLERIELPENTKITVTITEAKPDEAADGLERSAGAWRDTVDCDTLTRNIYADRLVSTRPVPEL